MADRMEYYQQIGELKKAVRERELHRLELEKQALLNAQARERRHEDFKDKIREIQRELEQKEREAAHNFQSLLARVDSIRREHKLLAAHTEQLRQRKLQYEMSLRSANPLLQTAVHQDLSGIYTNSDEAAWKGHIQATSTPFSRSQPQQHTRPSQPLVSPTALYNPAPPGHMSTQPMDRHIPPGVNIKDHHQHSFTTPMTSIPTHSASLTEDSLPHYGMTAHTPQGSMTRTPSYHQPSSMDYMVPKDIPREPPPHEGMVLHPHTMTKTSTISNQPPRVDYTTPQVSRDPSTVPHVSRELLSHVDYINVSRQPLPHTGIAPQTQTNAATTPTTYIHPSHLSHMIPNNVSGIDVQQNHAAIHSATRDQPGHNMDAFPMHTSDPLVANNPSSSIPSHLQNAPYPSGAEISYLNQLQSSLQSQHLSSTNSPQTSEHLPQIHSNLPADPTDGVSNYAAKSVSEKGLAPEYTVPHLKTFSHNTHNYETSSPASNHTLHPQSNTQYNAVALAPSTEIYKPQPNLLINTEIPEKDTTNPLPASTLRQDPAQVDKVPKKLMEEELARKSPTMPKEDDRSREMFSPGKHTDDGMNNDSLMREEDEKDSNPSTKKPLDVLTHDNAMQDREHNTGKAAATGRSIIENRPATSTGTDQMEAKHDVVSHTKSSLPPSQATVTTHENNHKPSPGHTTDNTTSLLKPEPVKPADPITGNDEGDRKGANKMTSLTHHKETEGNEIKFSDRQLTSSNDGLSSSAPMRSNPDQRSNLFKESSSSAPTSVLPSKPSQNEEHEPRPPDKHPGSSQESSPSLPTKSNTRPTSALPPKALLHNAEDSDTDFFDQNTNVTDSAAYKTLVGKARKGSQGTDSENGASEGQVSGSISKPYTQLSRSAFKSFASSIPSLSAPPPDTDTDSVDSVEAAIQAAMKKKDLEAAAEPTREAPRPPSSLKEEAKSVTAVQQDKDKPIKPGIDNVPNRKKQNTAAALQINLDSECESYEVSGGGDASDEDDFDFYDKF